MTTRQGLPADLYHLIAAELSDRYDFPTLFNYIVSCKQLASNGAIAALYRISHLSPVKGGGEDAVGGPAEQELVVQRWSILWRTIILSAFGETIYPYCKHLQSLDLRDLSNLLENDKFRGRISENFFSGVIAQYHHLDRTHSVKGKRRAARLDISKIVMSIGDLITQHAPRLESLSEPTISDVLSNVLPNWAPRLLHLKSLDLWDGKALRNETNRNLLLANCPNLSSLWIYTSSNDDADHSLAAFIGGMQENTLTYFENISNCHIGAETCLALGIHGKSLKSLKLELPDQGVLALALLQSCTSLESLAVVCSTASVDLKATQNDVFLEIVDWLKNCTALRDVSFTNFISAPDLLLPVLLNKDVALHKLQINASEGAMYAVKDHLDFHEALSQQPSLQRLLLRADSDGMVMDSIETMMNGFCSLKNLRELNLTRISDYLSDVHIGLLAKHLEKLEDIYIGGYGISDAVWPHLASLKNLKVVSLSGITSFTADKILGFIDSLGVEHTGLQLSVDNADPDSGISPEGQELIREVMASKLDGRFEYQLLRDPDMPEFDSEDSD